MELFKYPVLAVWLMAALAALVFLRFKAEKTKWILAENVLGKKTLQRLSLQKGWARKRTRDILLLTALFFAAVAASGPQWGMELAQITDLNGNLVIAVDTSLSMAAKDLKPSRLENAKLMLGALAEKFPDYRIGVVAFAGRAYVQCPLTTDLDAIKYFISLLSPGMLPSKGTDLSDAIETSGRMLEHYGSQKVMVLITDGEDHSKNLDQAIKDAAAAGLRVFTIGIGKPEGELIAETDAAGGTLGYKKDASGKTVVTKLDERTLLKIASQTGGAYLRYSDPDAAGEEMRSAVSRLSLTKTKGFGRANFKNRYQWPLALALLALLLELLFMENPEASVKAISISSRLRRWLGLAFRRVVPVFLTAVAMQQTLSASEAKSLAGKGTDAYDKKDYPKAYEYYGKALELEPKNSKIIFNSGDVFYRLEDYSHAGEAFNAASAASPAISHKARYNEGNAYFMQGDYKKAAASYRSAVLSDPKDKNAKFNLQRALERLQENNKNQQQKDKQKKDPKKDDKKKDGQDKDKNKNEGQDKEKQRKKDEARAQADRLLEMMKEKEKSAANKQIQDARFENKPKERDEAGEDW
ncbi:MAG: VWA domain-containing protein [Elusimicrobia bacterium]|nr:VWA domain-containing protein [Elusimicrobiota bacterium]